MNSKLKEKIIEKVIEFADKYYYHYTINLYNINEDFNLKKDSNYYFQNGILYEIIDYGPLEDKYVAVIEIISEEKNEESEEYLPMMELYQIGDTKFEKYFGFKIEDLEKENKEKLLNI